MLDVSAAVGAVHVRKGHAPRAPPRIERPKSLLYLALASAVRSNVGQIDHQHFGDEDPAAGLILVGEVFAERPLGAFNIFCSAARADFARSISDDPDRALAERAVRVSLFRAEPSASPFGWARHRALQSLMAAS